MRLDYLFIISVKSVVFTQDKIFELSSEQIQSFKKAFDLFDKNGNGKISKQEIQIVFKQLKIQLTQAEINKIICQFDQNGDDNIEFQEFITVLAKEQGESQAWLFEVFEIIDQNCDGLVTKQDLIKIIKLYDLQIKEKEVNQILQQCDRSGEHGINYEQFCSVLSFK